MYVYIHKFTYLYVGARTGSKPHRCSKHQRLIRGHLMETGQIPRSTSPLRRCAAGFFYNKKKRT